MLTEKDIAQTIDHALLHPTLSEEELEKGLSKVAHLPLASVCVKPCHVARALAQLADGNIKVGAVLGFPQGAHTANTKVAEAVEMAAAGASELDMVVNVGQVLGGDWSAVERELKAVKTALADAKVVLKLIFETDFVDRKSDIQQLTRLCAEAGWDYAKTSTGFGFVKQENGDYAYRGAQAKHLRWMREASPSIGLKASGGIRSLADWREMTEAGASRIGTSSTLSIMAEVQGG